MTDEDYRGPATIRIGEHEVAAEVRLSARFEPVEGRYRWSGRTGPNETLLEEVRSGARTGTIHIGERAAPATLSDPDPWGGVRLTGIGAAPWNAGQRM